MTRLKLAPLIVTLPLLTVALSVTAIKPAVAAQGAAAEAVRILSRAHAADRKCSYLSPAERGELSRYTERAEIAAASQSSAAAAKSASKAGKAEGAKGRCSADLEADVRETLIAAREAVASVGSSVPSPKTSIKPQRNAVQGESDGGSGRLTGKGLKLYAQVVRAYYLERKCRSLPRGDANRFWKGVVALHKSTVAANGVKSVAQVMRNAEAGASGSSCGGKARGQIVSGYARVSDR
jgi:hypothetical protein